MSQLSSTRVRAPVLLAFACVYLFWGSTYAAIRIAGMSLAPPLVAALRSILSTLLICGICLLRGKSLRVSRADAWRLIVVGILLMTCNNVLLTWAETMVPSGLAALIVATMPIMIALIEAATPGGEALNGRGWAGTLLGTTGLVALLWPSLQRTPPTGGRHLGAFAILFVATLAFAIGSILQRRWRFQVDTFVATGWQIGAAGLVNLTIATLGGTFHTAVWNPRALAAVAYLSVFGSIIGLSAYTYLLQNVPVTKVSTYAFVNPAIAVLLGVVLLHERLERAEVFGMGIIILSVILIILSKVKRSRGETTLHPAEGIAESTGV